MDKIESLNNFIIKLKILPHNHSHNHSHDHSHNHSNSHAHSHSVEGVSETKLFFVVILNLIITLAEILGGIFSGSLALISDALHNFSDSVAVISSLIAIRLGKRAADNKKTFGYKRAEILVALFNAAILIGISIFLFFEAFRSLLYPQKINTSVMIPVAIISLVANAASALLLHADVEKSLNLRSSYLHLLSDALISVGVLVGALLIKYFQIYWIDAVLTFIIGIFVIRAAYYIFLETCNILMQGAPSNVNISDISNHILEIPGVCEVHDIHVWQMNEREFFLDAHIQVDENLTIDKTDILRSEINNILEHHFDIQNSVLQIENKC